MLRDIQANEENLNCSIEGLMPIAYLRNNQHLVAFKQTRGKLLNAFKGFSSFLNLPKKASVLTIPLSLLSIST